MRREGGPVSARRAAAVTRGQGERARMRVRRALTAGRYLLTAHALVSLRGALPHTTSSKSVDLLTSLVTCPHCSFHISYLFSFDPSLPSGADLAYERSLAALARPTGFLPVLSRFTHTDDRSRHETHTATTERGFEMCVLPTDAAAD